MENDASVTGIGDILTQDGHPLAFVNRALGGWRQKSGTVNLRKRVPSYYPGSGRMATLSLALEIRDIH